MHKLIAAAAVAAAGLAGDVCAELSASWVD